MVVVSKPMEMQKLTALLNENESKECIHFREKLIMHENKGKPRCVTYQSFTNIYIQTEVYKV